MEYGRIIEIIPQNRTQTQTRKSILVKYARIITLLAISIVALTIIIVVIVISKKDYKNTTTSPSPTLLCSGGLDRICRVTRYPDLCVDSLREYMNKKQLKKNNYNNNYYCYNNVIELSMDVTIEKLRKTLDYFVVEKKRFDEVNDSYQWSVHDDCVELMEDSVDLLTRTHSLMKLLASSPSSNSTTVGLYDDHQTQNYMMDLMTWMTTICTNHDTCTEGFEEAGGVVKDQTAQIVEELSQIISNHLTLSSTVINCDVVSGKRLSGLKPNIMDMGDPRWMSMKNMELLGTPLKNFEPNITVSQDDIGPNVTVRTIGEAIRKAPKNSSTPFIIHVTAGWYYELNLTVGKYKTNLWFIGDGKGKTIISGKRSVVTDNVTTSKTPTFGATGLGFVARGITFENTAGPENHQAVSLYVKSDQSVFYECEIKGYQDTLYVHSNRQFYRNCDIYGTVDFIFGNAQVVFQNCTIYSRLPMEQQKNTITAQKRSQTCPDSYSGISIHQCQIRAASDLEQVKSNYSTYLGRPWREFSTVVYMLSYIGDHIDPQGWLPWNSTSSLNHVFYGEYMNYGPRANTSQRMQSPGIHVNMSFAEAAQFTVDQFVGGSWIAQTKVPYEAGFGKLEKPSNN